MERAVVAFREDDAGEWVAELECGHDQHVRHRPPFEQRPWILSSSARADRIGTNRDCPLCDRSMLPNRIEAWGRTQEWTEASMPAGLRRTHTLPTGRWARLRVRAGELRYSCAAGARTIAAGDIQPIPPGVPHDVEPLGPVRFSVELFVVVPPCREGRSPQTTRTVEGGDVPCMQHLVCLECGAVEPSGHRVDCSQGSGP